MEISLRIKKKVSHALRHAPEQYGLQLDKYGVVEISSFSAAMGLTVGQVKEIVDTDNKQRLGLIELENGQQGIYARQGHSFFVEPRFLTEFTEYKGRAFHGTVDTVIDSIFTEGLVPQSRLYVHLSPDKDTALNVGSRRKGELVILTVDIQQMIEDGFQVFISENGVILTKYVPVKYITK